MQGHEDHKEGAPIATGRSLCEVLKICRVLCGFVVDIVAC
jgi:hypothetical protein